VRRLVLITLSFGLLGAAQPAGAVVAYMHEFSLIKNGNQTFLDTFDDGLEPPSAPDYTPAGGGGPASYGIGAGTYQSDAESGGRLRMNSLDGDTVVNASGFANSSLFAVLLTNADPTNTINGLKSNHTFSITGTFGLVTNGGPLYSGYGIGFNDAGGGLARRNEVNLQVQYSMGLGMEIIRLSYQDFDAATVTTVAYIPLAAPAGTDEIALTLSRADLATTDLGALLRCQCSASPRTRHARPYQPRPCRPSRRAQAQAVIGNARRAARLRGGLLHLCRRPLWSELRHAGDRLLLADPSPSLFCAR